MIKELLKVTYPKDKTVCFTGHRPEKLPGLENSADQPLRMIKSMLYFQIYRAAESGYKYFISGLARGIDLWAAEYVFDIKNRFPDIKLICAKPFAQHGENFKGDDLWCLSDILSKADDVVCVSDSYSKDCYRLRNQYMVDRSSRLIAVVDNFKSGTGQTINYARKMGLELNIIYVRDYIPQGGGKAAKDGVIYID